MHYAHLNMNEAILAFQDIGAKYFIPTHWGTFQLGDEPPGYPLVDIRRTLNTLGVDASKALVMNIGDMIRIPGKGIRRK